jgi:hypothetical protein
MRVDLQLSPSFFLRVSSYASDAENAVRVFDAIRPSLYASETCDFCFCFDNNDEEKIVSEQKKAEEHHRHAEKRGASDALQGKG